jgi:hypothetical protein
LRFRAGSPFARATAPDEEDGSKAGEAEGRAAAPRASERTEIPALKVRANREAEFERDH